MTQLSGTAHLNPKDLRDAIDLFVERHFRPVSFVILAGSYARGEARADSDVDLIILKPAVKQGAHQLLEFQGRVYDAHVHDLQTLHFLLRSECNTGPVEVTKMVANGRVLPSPTAESDQLQRAARDFLRHGPIRSKQDIYRFELTQALRKLPLLPSAAQRSAAAHRLFQQICHAAMHANGRFIAVGADMGASLIETDSSFYLDICRALSSSLVDDNHSSLIAIGKNTLQELGGELRYGLSTHMPPQNRLPWPLG